MRTMLRGKLTLLFMAFALVLALPAVALADQLRNTLESSANSVVNYTAGGSAVSVGYWIFENSSGGQQDCDASDGSAATATLNVTKDGQPSTAVNISPSSQSFTACGEANAKSFSFSTAANAAPGDYVITGNVQDSLGNYHTPNATFTLRVSAPQQQQNQAPTVQNAAADANGNEGDTLQTNGSFSDPDGDSLTITKQSGAGTVTPGANGAWSWSLPTNDNGSGTVVVQASDGKGGTVTDSFDWNAANVDPVIGALNLTGANATACQSSPGRSVGLSFSINDVGTADTHDGTIYWGDGQSEPFTGSSVNTSHSYVGAGTFTIKVEANDDDGGTDTRSAANGVDLRYQVSQLLSPVNPAGSQMSVFKHGSTVPLKVQITDCLGDAVSGLTPSIKFTKINPNTPAIGVNEGTSTSSANSDFVMRYDATNQHYIYNLGTKSLADGDATYQANVRNALIQNMDSQTFGLRTK